MAQNRSGLLDSIFAKHRVKLNMLRMAIQGLEMEKVTLTGTQQTMMVGVPKKDP